MEANIDLPYLASRLFDTPHMITVNKLDTILTAVAPRIFNGGKISMDHGKALSEQPREAYRLYRGIAIIPIHGTLVRRGSWLGSMSGLTSYEGLKASFREAMRDQDVKAVMFDIDSGGGEAGGVFDLVDEMRKLSQRYKKPVWAHANENACSAAYAIACAAEKIWIARTGQVGSIGVVSTHLDRSSADEKAGFKWTFIYKGDHKVHGNPHEPLAEKAYAKIQADCDLLYKMFVKLVSDYRPMQSKDIYDTKAETFIGYQAVELGLADHEGTFEKALKTLVYCVDKESTETQLKGKTEWHADATAQKTQTKNLKTTSSIKKPKMKSLTKSLKVKTPSKTLKVKTSTKTPKTKMLTKTSTMKTSRQTLKTKSQRQKHAAQKQHA